VPVLHDPLVAMLMPIRVCRALTDIA
jgi:hypothetical protein